jgi:hypothetical protein
MNDDSPAEMPPLTLDQVADRFHELVYEGLMSSLKVNETRANEVAMLLGISLAHILSGVIHRGMERSPIFDYSNL